MKSSWRLLSILLTTLILISCGGGGNNDATILPRANAGEPQQVETGDIVVLDGSASSTAGGGSLSYSWVITSKPADSLAELRNPTTVNPTLTTDIAGDYIVSLTVNDGITSSAPVSLTITAIPAPTPRSATLSITWGGTISNRTVGGLDMTIRYNQNLATFATATSGSLTRQWLISAYQEDNSLRAGLIGTPDFAADNSTGTVLSLEFTPRTNQLAIDDFSVSALSFTDPSYNTERLNPEDVRLELILHF